jgi:hypothetical protein
LEADAGQKHGPGGVDENEILAGESGTIPMSGRVRSRWELGPPIRFAKEEMHVDEPVGQSVTPLASEMIARVQ